MVPIDDDISLEVSEGDRTWSADEVVALGIDPAAESLRHEILRALHATGRRVLSLDCLAHEFVARLEPRSMDDGPTAPFVRPEPPDHETTVVDPADLGAVAIPAASALTAAAVLGAARARGIPAFPPTPVTDTKILLGSLGLDLRSPAIQRALLDLNRRGEIALVRVDMMGLCRLDLIGRGIPSSLLDESEIRTSISTFHAVMLPPAAAEPKS